MNQSLNLYSAVNLPFLLHNNNPNPTHTTNTSFTAGSRKITDGLAPAQSPAMGGKLEQAELAINC